MKAEHRKELHTNLLADRVGRMVEGLKSGPKTSSLVIWIIALLALLALGVWRYMASVDSLTRSSLWVKVGAANDVDQLEDLAKENRGTLPARIARFQEARLLMKQGLQNLGSYFEDSRKEAKTKLELAGKLFEQLAQECRDDRLLVQEALMGAAKAKESTGDLEGAQSFYQKLAELYPTSFLGEAAARRVKELQDNRANVVSFYEELSKRGIVETPKEDKKP